LNAIEKERPDVILTEVMLPKVDGFLIREKTMASSDLKNKVFIFMSHLKDENTIQRAVALQIEHYFKKPCIPAEIVGLIKNKLTVKQ
jgi:two-component system, cell cycle response regulator